MSHLGRGVERVGVYENQPGLQNSEGHDWVAEAVRHLHCNSIARLKTGNFSKVNCKTV